MGINIQSSRLEFKHCRRQKVALEQLENVGLNRCRITGEKRYFHVEDGVTGFSFRAS